jgi:hypothetical protein
LKVERPNLSREASPGFGCFVMVDHLEEVGSIPGATAVDAVLFVDGNQLPASRALPAVLFAGDKLVQPKEADALEILDHAHAVFSAIALVDMFYASTGVLSAFKTEAPHAQAGLGAGPYLTLGTGLGHAAAVAIAAWADSLPSDIGPTEGAVHAAGSNDHHEMSIQAFSVRFNREN